MPLKARHIRENARAKLKGNFSQNLTFFELEEAYVSTLMQRPLQDALLTFALKSLEALKSDKWRSNRFKILPKPAPYFDRI